MLHRESSGRFEPWSTGSAAFLIDHEARAGRMQVAVRCRLGGQKTVLAMLDTGAAWSILDGVTAQLLRGHLEDLGISISMTTRIGRFRGTLHRVSIELLADSGVGSDLACDATALVLDGWPGPVVLGFQGLLERVRVALDPDADRPLFYFGPRT